MAGQCRQCFRCVAGCPGVLGPSHQAPTSMGLRVTHALTEFSGLNIHVEMSSRSGQPGQQTWLIFIKGKAALPSQLAFMLDNFNEVKS